MEKLSSLDGVFLAIENRHTPMNIGSVAIFDGPVPSLDDMCDLLSSRIALVPRCRQRVREPQGPFGRPVWVDDVHFDIRNHLQATSIAERDDRDFEELVADLMVDPLDRGRPLWRIRIVDGVAPDRWALVALVHHCLVDGVGGNDLLTALLSPAITSTSPPEQRWQPTPEPSSVAHLSFQLRQALHSALSLLRNAANVLTHPRRSWRRAGRTIGAAKRLWYRQQHAPSSLIGPIGPGRRWKSLSIPLTEVGTVQATFGCTVNDVVVAAVTAGFRTLLTERGESVTDRSVTALVPVSLRTDPQRSGTGNRVANVHAHLPVGDQDPASMLRKVHAHLDELKNSHEVDATGFLMNVGNYVPRFFADRIARSVVGRQRNVETVITDVPGPRSTLHLGSHRMIECYPIAPIAGQVRITVAIWSYCDTLTIGITGDRETVGDIGTLRDGIARGFEQLIRAAKSNH